MSDAPAHDVNLEQDIPGCEDNYYRCIIKCLRISRGWIDFFSTISLMLAAILGAVSAGNYKDEDLIVTLGILTAVITGSTAAFRIFKNSKGVALFIFKIRVVALSHQSNF